MFNKSSLHSTAFQTVLKERVSEVEGNPINQTKKKEKIGLIFVN
jgi:hypothetical protein